jgi:hypothetical protein
MSDKLTLNLGLRWEATTPLTEKFGRWANFEYDLTNTALGAPGALAFAGDGDTSFMRNRDWSELGPRAGLAYQINDRLVARGAYGVVYMPLGLNFWSGVPYGFTGSSRDVNQVLPNADFTPVFNWDGGYPGTVVPGKEDPNAVFYPMVRIDPDALRAGRIQQWNAGVEWQLFSSTVVGVNYVGNRGSRLQSDQFERNQPADAAAFSRVVTSGNEFTWIASPEDAAAVGVAYPYPGYQGYASQALQPFPQIGSLFGPLFVIGVPEGKSDYHSMQLTFSRRGTRGLTFDLGYTLSRARGNATNAFEENWWNGTIQDSTKLDLEAKTPTGLDLRHVFKGYVSYELPFGAGQRFLDRPGAINAIVGGWTIAGIGYYASGRPIYVYSNNSYAFWGWYGSIYPNVNPNGDFSSQFNKDSFNATDPGDPGNRYFDRTLYTNPTYGEFGNAGPLRAKLRDFGYMREDVSLLKNFRIGDVRLQFRAEFYNVFNRHYFNTPDRDINSPYFGQVTSVGANAPRTGQLGLRMDF